MKREESLDREQNVSVSFSKRKEWPRKCTHIHTHKMQRSDTIRLRESFFDRFCRILLSFFFSSSFSRHVQYRLQKKKKMYRIFIHSPGKYFKSTNIATFLFHHLSDIYVVLNSIKKKNYCNFFHMHIRQNEHKNWYINRECRKNIFSIVYNKSFNKSLLWNLNNLIFQTYSIYIYILLRIKDNHYL